MATSLLNCSIEASILSRKLNLSEYVNSSDNLMSDFTLKPEDELFYFDIVDRKAAYTHEELIFFRIRTL
jgi:hypothetical protein